ncbi:ChrR family anti-sigma-E factor [Maritimibacter sp. UBA3975]|uniref:ChrR family anti-sigma-E factor n=1 Tax=Maritimibacter sp. UBA3975 TaxID=1946833 RepID=UPI000C090975|nr:ChrR family anti-sigma-E factor [Maritimibacter sp. UBA3975]MAM63393.1 transcriptional regulator [Maritimibacter sp.]|tara:strand:- start:88472 stop:89113 length:642 start_codon:yes stop_codon:yes gene_type:complete
MSEQISHHIPEALIAAYAAGSLSKAYSLVVATHVSMCDTCRASLMAHEAAGGAVLESVAEEPLSGDLRKNLMDRLDDPIEYEADTNTPDGIYPGPVASALRSKSVKWKKLGGGVRQCIIDMDREGSARLLHIPAGKPVPEHSHGGLELTLVLQGGFSDDTGHFDVGDVEVADGDLEHVPTADPGVDCICLAATDAPLRFSAFVPRILQPFFAI